jgi:hypothetical protein
MQDTPNQRTVNTHGWPVLIWPVGHPPQAERTAHSSQTAGEAAHAAFHDHFSWNALSFVSGSIPQDAKDYDHEAL